MNLKKSLVSGLTLVGLLSAGCGGGGGGGSVIQSTPSQEEINKTTEYNNINQYTTFVDKSSDGVASIIGVLSKDQLKQKLSYLNNSSLPNDFINLVNLVTDGQYEEGNSFLFHNDGKMRIVTSDSIASDKDRIYQGLNLQQINTILNATEVVNVSPVISDIANISGIVGQDSKEVLLKVTDADLDLLSVNLSNNSPSDIHFEYNSESGDLRIEYKPLSEGTGNFIISASDNKNPLVTKTVEVFNLAGPSVNLESSLYSSVLGTGIKSVLFNATGEVSIENSNPDNLYVGVSKLNSNTWQLSYDPKSQGTFDAYLVSRVGDVTKRDKVEITGVMPEKEYFVQFIIRETDNQLYDGAKTQINKSLYDSLIQNLSSVPTQTTFPEGIEINDSSSVEQLAVNYRAMDLDNRTLVSNVDVNGEILDRFLDTDDTNGTTFMIKLFTQYK